ncbi:MAG: YkgJ family cysteine cluster protein [Candidatus Odinarchaeota archaeon]
MNIIPTDKSRNLSLVLEETIESPVIYDFGPESTFSRFSCIPDCQDCCGYAYFLPSEVEKLPTRIKEQLVLEGGKHEILTRNGRCVFYSPDKSLNCSIHVHRPLRCRIYPYFPLIVDQRVVITLEPALKMKNKESDLHHRCPGVGEPGKPLRETLDDCLSFLKKLAEVPDLLATVILDGEKFSKLRNDRWFIEQDEII